MLIYEIISSALFITCFQAFRIGSSIMFRGSFVKILSRKCWSPLPCSQRCLSKPFPRCLLGRDIFLVFFLLPTIFLMKVTFPWLFLLLPLNYEYRVFLGCSHQHPLFFPWFLREPILMVQLQLYTDGSSADISSLDHSLKLTPESQECSRV